MIILDYPLFSPILFFVSKGIFDRRFGPTVGNILSVLHTILGISHVWAHSWEIHRDNVLEARPTADFPVHVGFELFAIFLLLYMRVLGWG